MPSQKFLKRLAFVAVLLGFLGLLVAAVYWVLQRQFDMTVKIALAFGVLGFAVAAVADPDTLATWLRGRQARYGSNVVLMTLAFAGIVGLVNYWVATGPIPAEWKRKDFTQDLTNTLAAETLTVLKALPAPVKAVYFYSSDNDQRDAAKKLLDQYQQAGNGQFTYEFIDLLGNPLNLRGYDNPQEGAVVVVMGQDKQKAAYLAETEITGALIRLVNPVSHVIYFLTGHGEHDTASSAGNGFSSNADLLKKQNYEVRTLSLQVTSTIPSDAREIVIAGGLAPLTSGEVKAVGDYLNQGGALVVLSDPPIQNQLETNQLGPIPADPLADYLTSAWGVNLEQDVVIDLYNSAYDNQNQMRNIFLPLNKGYESSQITQGLENINTGFLLARSIRLFGTAEAFPDIKYTPLVKTDSRAWGAMDLQKTSDSLSAGQTQRLPGDAPGPLVIAATAQNGKTKGRVVVFGDSDFATNDWAKAGGNSKLFLNCVNWAAQDEALINLTPKVPTSRTLNIVDAFPMYLIFFLTVLAMPGAVLVIGIVVWVLRRRHV